MSDMLFDYSDSYNQLKYKYKKVMHFMDRRSKNCIKIESLVMKNGGFLGFVITPRISELLNKITDLLERTKVDTSVKSVIFEGFYSSVIEGAKTTLPETVRIVKGEKKPTTKSEQMVWNNVKLVNQYFNSQFSFTEGSVISAWKILIDKVCDNEEIKGDKYRNGQVVVGNDMEVTFQPPKHVEVQEYMDRLFRFCNASFGYSPLIKAIIISYYLVYTHPFCDGNGRLSRFLLQQWLINTQESAKFRYISLSSAVNESRLQYYKALENSENVLNDITYFIEYYLQVMELQLQRSLNLFGVDIQLNERQKSILKKITPGGISRKKYAALYKVSATTAAGDLDELVGLGELRQVKDNTGAFHYYKVVIK